MTTADYPDWLTPVAVVDQAADLLGGVVNFSNGSTTGDYDTSAVSTLSVVITPPNGAAGERYQFGMSWFENGIRVDIDTLTFHSLASYGGNVSSLYWRIPVRGTAAVFGAITQGGNTFNVSVFTSTRQVAGQRVTAQGQQVGQFLQSISFGSVAAGATSATFYIPPVARAVNLAMNQNINAVALRVFGVHANGALLTNHQVLSSPGDFSWNGGQALEIPGVGLEVVAINNDTVAHITTLNVWDAS